MQRHDVKNGIAVHAWSREHGVNWDSARVVHIERCATEALHIHQEVLMINLDCGLHIQPIWNPILNIPLYQRLLMPYSQIPHQIRSKILIFQL